MENIRRGDLGSDVYGAEPSGQTLLHSAGGDVDSDDNVDEMTEKSSCWRMNLHDLLYYETAQLVHIEDAKLGCLYYLVSVALLAYIVIDVFYGLGYLDFDIPETRMTLDLREPTMHGCSPMLNASCNQDWRPLSELDYCCNDQCTPAKKSANQEKDHGWCFCPGEKMPRAQCWFVDQLGIKHAMPKSWLIVTCSEYQIQSREPENPDERKRFDWHRFGVQKVRYTADIERYTMWLDHSFSLPKHEHVYTSQDMDGYLKVGPTGDKDTSTESQKRLCRDREDAVDAPWFGKPTNEVPCFIVPDDDRSSIDLFKVQLLLDAAGIDLDDTSPEGGMGRIEDADGNTAKALPLRSQGLSITIRIHYFNSLPMTGLVGNVTYYYEVVPSLAIPAPAFGSNDVYSDEDREHNYESKRRIVSNRGIEVKYQSSGVIGRWSFSSLLNKITEIFVLILVFHLVVNYSARYLMRWSKYYHASLVEDSGNFGELGKLMKLSEDELSDRLEDLGLVPGGSREERILKLLPHSKPTSEKERADEMTDIAGVSEETPLLSRGASSQARPFDKNTPPGADSAGGG